MKTRTLAFLFLTVFSSRSVAQSDSTERKHFTYFNNLFAGGLLGEKGIGSSLSASTNHGIRYKRISAGAGVGYDAYGEWSAMPLTAFISYDIVTANNNALYVQCMGGYSYAWFRSPENNWVTIEYDSKGGGTLSPTIGYRIKADRWSLYLAMGYKFQRIKYESTTFWGGIGQESSLKTTVEQDIKRFSVQIGIGLN
jgi:hypothetical protein